MTSFHSCVPTAVNVQGWGGTHSPEVFRSIPYRTYDTLHSQGSKALGGLHTRSCLPWCRMAPTIQWPKLVTWYHLTGRQQRNVKKQNIWWAPLHLPREPGNIQTVTLWEMHYQHLWTGELTSSERICNLLRVTQVPESGYEPSLVCLWNVCSSYCMRLLLPNITCLLKRPLKNLVWKRKYVTELEIEGHPETWIFDSTSKQVS